MRRAAFLTPPAAHDACDREDRNRYVLNLAKAVARVGGYEVDIVSCADVPAVARVSLAPGVTSVKLPAVASRAGSEPLSWQLLEAFENADLVHVHELFTRTGEVGVFVARLLGKPVCGTDYAAATSALGASLGMLDLLGQVVAPTRFGLSQLRTRTPSEVVPGCVDDDHFSLPEHPVRRDRIVFAGPLMPEKGVDRVIDALPDHVALVVCGRACDERYFADLQEQSQGKRVEFLADADDVQRRELYRRALAVVLTAVHVDRYGDAHVAPELIGLSLLEGMACGAPAVCSGAGALPELVDHGVTGYICDTVEDLRQRIEELSGEPERSVAMGRQAADRVVATAGLRATGRAMGSVYDGLLST